MNEYIFLSNSKCREINLQIIRSFAVLILNITNKISLYYIFSNNFINNIISNNNFDKYDDDFLSYYVNFLKSLALKIDLTTIQFFFHSNINSFPLLESAIKIYNHPDPMIKNVVRNIFLTICRLNYPPFFDYLCCLPSVSYFTFITCRLRDMIINLNKENNYEKFKSLQEDIIDDIIYIQDIFSLELDKINYILTNCLFYYCIMPLILKSLISNENGKININIALYSLCLMLFYIKNENFLNLLFTLIFLPLRNKGLNKYIQNYPIQPTNYYYDWNKQKKQTLLTFQTYIQYNCSGPFLKSLIHKKNSSMNEIREIVNKYEEISDKDDTFNPNSDSFLTKITKDVISYFSNSEMNIMTMYHNYLSIATGVNCGLSTKNNQYCVMMKFKKLYTKYFDESLNLKYKLINNDIKTKIFSFLNKKDDDLILITNIFIRLFLINDNELITKFLLQEGKLLNTSLLNDNDIKKINEINNDPNFNIEDYKYEKNNSPNIILQNKDNNEIIELNDINLINRIGSNQLKRNYYEVEDEDEITTNNNLPRYQSMKLKPEKIKVSLKDFVRSSQKLSKKKDEIRPSIIVLSNGEFEKYDKNYFDKIEKNINEYNEKNEIQIPQFYYYDTNLLEFLLNLISPFKPLRHITIKSIFDNIYSLIIKKDMNSNKYYSIVSLNQLNKIENIYNSFTSEIKNSYLKKEKFKEKTYSLIQIEYKKYKEMENFNFQKLILNCHLFLPIDIIGLTESYPTYLNKINQDSIEETYNNNILTFFYIHDLLYTIKNIYSNTKKDLIKDKFPIQFNEFKVDKQYNIVDIGPSIERYECQSRGNNATEYSDSLILIYGNGLYVGRNSSNPNYTRISNKFFLSECNVQIDRSDPRVVMLFEIGIDNNINNIDFLFKDVEMAKRVKRNVEEHSKNAKRAEEKKLDYYIYNL